MSAKFVGVREEVMHLLTGCKSIVFFGFSRFELGRERAASTVVLERVCQVGLKSHHSEGE